MARHQKVSPFLAGDPDEQRRSHGSPGSSNAQVVVFRPHVSRHHRYRRRHTLHYYIVLTGLTLAATVITLNTIAYISRSVTMATVAFFAVVVTTLVISTAFFWGFFMVMNGNFPARRIKVLIPHATVGVLSPLIYTLNISVELDGVGQSPVGGLALACSIVSFGLLLVQFTMGKLVVRPARLRVIRKLGPD